MDSSERPNDAMRDATQLLELVEQGDVQASEQLLPLVYDELRRIAGGYLRRGGGNEMTLQATALVNEAWVRLAGGAEALQVQSSGHFCAIAARAMRNILVDHRRAKGAAKRDSGGVRETLAGLSNNVEEQGASVLDLNDSLEKLEAFDPELGRLVELRYFAGLTIAETAEALELSSATVERRWRVARAWLREYLPDLR